MNRQVAILAMKPTTDMCVILCLPMSQSTQKKTDEVDVDENGPPEHLWNSIAPFTEEHRLQSMAEGSEQLTEVSQQDFQDNQNILSQSSLHIRFESSANKQEIPPEQYRQYIRELNDEQRSIVMFHRDWCKKAVLALKQNKPVQPYHVFLSGPGGVGKSHQTLPAPRHNNLYLCVAPATLFLATTKASMCGTATFFPTTVNQPPPNH